MDDELAARLAALEARQAQLETTIADLRLELAAQTGGFRSMRDRRRCPACNGEALLHVRELHSNTGSFATLAIALAYEMLWSGTKTKGILEAFACRRCGLVELHAVETEAVPTDGEKIVAVDPEGDPPTAGPYR